MATSFWANAVKKVREYVVMIETPGGRGTGFLVPPPPGGAFSTVVTAHHVIQHADDWREPVKLVHLSSGKQAFLDIGSRYINANPARDIAILAFNTRDITFPTDYLPLLEMNHRLFEGVEIGWLGFPSVAPSNMCFFCGHVSAWLEPDEAYLIDGVAINGVSGGPAFVQDEKENPTIIGLVTEYRPNYATGNVLPGVSLVRAINPIVQHYAQLENAKKQIDQAKVQSISEGDSKGGLPTSFRK